MERWLAPGETNVTSCNVCNIKPSSLLWIQCTFNARRNSSLKFISNRFCLSRSEIQNTLISDRREDLLEKHWNRFSSYCIIKSNEWFRFNCRYWFSHVLMSLSRLRIFLLHCQVCMQEKQLSSMIYSFSCSSINLFPLHNLSALQMAWKCLWE